MCWPAGSWCPGIKGRLQPGKEVAGGSRDSKRTGKFPAQLSGGEAQRVGDRESADQ